MLSRSQLAVRTAVSVLRHAKNAHCFCILNMETTVPFGRAISVRQLAFAVLSDNVFWNRCMWRQSPEDKLAHARRLETSELYRWEAVNRLLLMSVERNINQRDWKSANGDRARILLEHGCHVLSVAEAIKRSVCLTIKPSFNVRKIAPSDMFRPSWSCLKYFTSSFTTL